MAYGTDFFSTIKSYHEAMKDKETYYIDPPTKIMLENLMLIWVIFFVTFLLTFNGLQSIFLVLWIPMILLLNFYSDLWSKVGFSLIIYWLLNTGVIVGSYFISKGIHIIVKFIIDLIGEI